MSLMFLVGYYHNIGFTTVHTAHGLNPMNDPMVFTHVSKLSNQKQTTNKKWGLQRLFG